MAAEVVEEETIFIALFLLVMGVHVAPIDHHVVAQDTGCVEGSLPWALKPIPALQGGPHAPIHVEELGGVHPHRKPGSGGPVSTVNQQGA